MRKPGTSPIECQADKAQKWIDGITDSDDITPESCQSNGIDIDVAVDALRDLLKSDHYFILNEKDREDTREFVKAALTNLSVD